MFSKLKTIENIAQKTTGKEFVKELISLHKITPEPTKKMKLKALITVFLKLYNKKTNNNNINTFLQTNTGIDRLQSSMNDNDNAIDTFLSSTSTININVLKKIVNMGNNPSRLDIAKMVLKLIFIQEIISVESNGTVQPNTQNNNNPQKQFNSTLGSMLNNELKNAKRLLQTKNNNNDAKLAKLKQLKNRIKNKHNINLHALQNENQR